MGLLTIRPTPPSTNSTFGAKCFFSIVSLYHYPTCGKTLKRNRYIFKKDLMLTFGGKNTFFVNNENDLKTSIARSCSAKKKKSVFFPSYLSLSRHMSYTAMECLGRERGGAGCF